jgi:guanine nucleotide exchange protein RalF
VHHKIKENSLEIAKTFNANPKGGVAMIEKICKENDIDDIKEIREQIANFFIAEKDKLNLIVVGQYMGDPKNTDLLQYFTEKMDFKNMEFTDALRSYLGSFHLPGEAQQVDRFMESFANEYSKQNDTNIVKTFNNTIKTQADGIFLLSFAVMMLNTDLYNSNVVKKMTLAQFQRNLQSSPDNLDTIDPKISEKIYDSIKKNEIKVKFMKNNPGIEMESGILKYDETFKGSLDYIAKTPEVKTEEQAMDKHDPKTLKFLSSLGLENNKFKVSSVKTPGNIFESLFGKCSGSINVRDEITDSAISIKIYKPNILSSLIFGEKSKVIVIPMSKNKDSSPSEGSLKLAGEIAGKFKLSENNVKFNKTFDHEEKDLKNSYDVAKAQENKPKPTERNTGNIIR